MVKWLCGNQSFTTLVSNLFHCSCTGSYIRVEPWITTIEQAFLSQFFNSVTTASLLLHMVATRNLETITPWSRCGF